MGLETPIEIETMSQGVLKSNLGGAGEGHICGGKR